MSTGGHSSRSNNHKDVLAFIGPVLGQITPFLSTGDICHLLSVGSPRLTAALMRPGVVTSVKLLGSMYPLKDTLVRHPRIQWATRFPSLTHLELTAQYRRGWGGNFRLSKLPKTLTSLILRHTCGFSFFIKDEILNPYLTMEDFDGSFEGLQRANQEILGTRQSVSPFADLGSLLPYLTHLEAPSSRIQYDNYLLWLKSLPPWLSLLRSPTLVPDYLYRMSVTADLVPAFSCLPPDLDTLICDAHQSWEVLLPEHLPPSITHLELTGNVSAKPLFASKNLRVLKLDCLHLTHAGFAFCFPPNLTSFALTSAVFEHQNEIYNTNDLFKQLPRQLLSLSVPYAKMIDAFDFLPQGLTSLSVNGFSFIHFKVINVLPKGLTHWSWHSRETLTPNLARELPRSLRTMSLPVSIIRDDCLGHIPESLYEIRCRNWILTGFTLDETVKCASLATMRACFAKRSVVHHPSVRRTYTYGLDYLPSSVVVVEDVGISKLKISDLSPLFVALPSSLPYVDSPKTPVSELPQTLTSIHIDGAARLATWLALPPTITLVRGGSVWMEDADVTEGLHAINKHLASIESECNVKHTMTTFNVPQSLSSHLLQKLYRLERSSIWPSGDRFFAAWGNHHYSLLPDSITDLHVKVALPQRLPFGWSSSPMSSSSSAHGDASADPKQSSPRPPPSLALKTLTLATSTAVLESKKDHSPLLNISSIFTLCKLSPTELPLSLTELSLFGNVSTKDIERFPRLDNLKILRIGCLADSFVGDKHLDTASFTQFCTILPPTLETLHLLKTEFHTDLVELLPRSLLELHIRTVLPYTAKAISSLPPNLTSLDINSTSIDPNYKTLLPASLTKIVVDTNRK